MSQIPFRWCIDTKNFIFSSDADKIKLKDFIKNYLPCIAKYERYYFEQLIQGTVTHTHICPDIGKLKSKEAKKIATKIEKINSELDGIAILMSDVLQINLGNINNKPVRCYGYILERMYYIIYIDIGHKVYKE